MNFYIFSTKYININTWLDLDIKCIRKTEAVRVIEVDKE